LNESFSIGLTCLDAATLTDSSKLYEPNGKFNYSKLDERLLALEKSGNYSAPLTLLIKGLCQPESEKRISCKELIEWLAKYESSIVELQEFTVNEVPEKLHRLTQEKVRPNKGFTQPPQLPTATNVLGNFMTAPTNQQNRQQPLPQQFINQGYPVYANPVGLPRPQSY
jgi:hypothetical protein